MLRCKNLYSTAFHSLLLVFTLLILGSQEAKATHATGTDLTYICIGPNQYAITLNVYRDCNGINLPANQTVSWTGSCGSGSINASRSAEQDITPVCPGGQSSCNNGSGTFGVEQHTYTSVITLPPGCTNVIFSWRLCCRNNAITTLNGPGSERMYVESFMSNTTTPCNNSPIFLNPPTSFTCRNNAVFYNHGATDFDGDSLSFSLTDCRDNAGVPVNYAAGHSGAAPFGAGIPVNIDPGTGAITFTPNIALVGVLCVLVEEYRNGILIGSIVRDIQFRVINCNNTSPLLSGVNGAGIDSIDFVTSACFGTQLCFDVIGSDPSNPGDVLTMTYDNAIPSATFVVSGPGVPSGNQVTGTFCWTPTIFDLGTHTFTITIQDDACPIVGSNTFTYVINVVTNPNDPVFAGTDVSICQGDTAFLNATTTSPNAVSYSWSPALGLSNPNIPNPEAKPPSTTCYTVTLQYNDGCFSTDFVCVTVEDDPPLALSPNGINACGGSSLTLSATTDALGANFTFTELFSPFSIVPNSVTGVTASAPITMPTTPGSYRWQVEVVNPITSCSTIDIITLTVGVIPTQPACRNIYASTTGSASAAGNQFDPVTLEEALARSACNLSVIKVATGTYNIDDPLNITSLLTLEGGFIESQSWLKTSEIGATTINRTKANARGVLNSTRNLTALEVFGSTGFRLQDLTITTDDALVPGTSTYGIYMNFASDYNITRCNIVPGAAADGTAGGTSCILPSISKDGANGVAGAIGDPDVVNDNIAGGGGGLAGLSCGSAALYIPGRGGDNADPSGCGIGTGCDGQGPSFGIGVVDGGAGGGGGRAGFGSPVSVGTLAGSGGDGAGGGTPLNPPFSGCSATATGVGSAAAGGAGNGFSNPSNNGGIFPLSLVGTSGTTGIDGVNGCVGSAGPSSQAICIYTVGVQAGTGMSGSGGSGGGGGGGGAGQHGITAGTGGAGGGGGGGGAGGFGGTGGYGGGGSFGIYMCDNGANGFIEDCFVVAGSSGAGGIGGAGQTGGTGGTGGIGGAPSSTDVGAGGNGGDGGQGGAGGQGGNASNGLAIDIFCFSCTSQPVVQDSTFQLFDQQIIFVENTNCTNAQVMFYDSGQVAAHPLTTTVGSGVTIGTPGASVTNWTFDAINGFAQPPTGTFNADTTRYDSIGRFTILHNEQGIALQEYTGFHNVAFDKSFKPDILSSANVLGPDTFQLCLGDFATFSSSIFGDTTRWEFNGAITNPGNVQFVPSTQFNVSGFFMVQLFLITDCCGDTPIDTAYIYVDPVPAVTGSGAKVICAGGNVNLAVFGLSPNDTVIWTPAINLGIISLDSANVSPTVTRTYKASVYTIITSGSQTRLSCPVALPYDITVNALPNPVMSSTNVVCSSDGTATATPPTGLYDFVWSDGSITSSAASSTINNLPTGSYCVTVTDLSSGCVDTGCIFVNPAFNLPALNVSTTPITCFGDNDGVATISTTGGTTTAVGYTYAISPAVPVVPNPSLTPVTLTGLAPGTYSVTSTDEIGCVTTLNFDITTPQPLTLNVIDTLNPVCQSTFDGRIEVEGQGGTGLLTYSWSNGVVTADSGILSGIDTGLYCVTVVDDNNCSAVFCHTLRPQQVLSTSLAVSAIPCNGGTACITVNAAGGSNAYAYDWSGPAAPTPFSTGNDVSCGFPASTSLYTVLITDSTFSCTTTASVSITEPSALSATIASQIDVNCFGDSTGIASAGASGGTPGYSYLWNYGTNETNVALDSLPDGVYTVTVTDATGVCTTTETVTITEPTTAVDVTAAISSNFNGQQVSCFGATDGEATATASGGTPASTGYDFQWDANAANQNTPIAVGLSVANNPYVVVVTDSLNCTDTDTIAFAQPSAVTATVSSSISVSCFGDSSGQATIAASGGTAPYSFLWSDGQSTLTGVGLQVANNPYCVTVTDNNGCSDVLCFNIAQPAAPITSSISVIADPSCFGGSDGSVFATASGGTGITTYLWGGGLATGQTNDTITGLPDGQYCVTISDANLCTTVECVTLTQPSQVTATISATQAIDCFGDTSGTATVSGSGGTLPGYGITWDNGQSTVQATGLVANIPHCVTITDNNGCPASTCITLTQSASAITVGATVISNYNGADLSCAGATDACVQANAANGTPFAVGNAYTYNWAPSASNDDSLCAVGAGVYAVTVTDSLGCQASATVTVGTPTALTASIISTTNVLCFGDSTGCADVATAGGTGTVTYLWPDGLTTAQNCNLFNGSHTVTVSDANGCTVTATAIINQPALPLTLASVVVDSTVKCNAGNDGGITANPSGGSGSYNFSWSNSATTATLTGLTQGTYCVTLTDVPNGCIDTACIQMTQPSAVTATITSQVNVNCFGAATGSATAAGSGGTALNPYTFVWDANAAGQNTATATGLIAGLQYCVTVSDDNGCFDVVCVTLTQPSAILSTTAVVAVNPAYNGSDVSCTGASDGMVVATGIDGAGGYSYDWGSGNSNDTLSNVAAGVYCVTVTDANACIATACATVTDPVALTTSINAIDVTNINCAGDSTGTALVTVTGGNLTVPYAYQWDNGLTTQQGTNLLAGQQCVSVTDANGCISVACVSITEPASAIVIAGITVDSNVSCNGLSDGGATAFITGGTPALGGYDFAWSGNGSTGQTTASITGLAAGLHCLIVTDSLLCVDTLCVTISEPVSVSANIDLSTAININCFGDSTGQATATATGGSGVYTFLWDANANNQNTATATGLQAGISYCVIVTDNNGCLSDSACVTLTQPASAINSSAVELTPVSCNAGADGAVQVTATGGTAAGSAYTFLWGTNAGSVTTATVNGLSVANGPYCVTATDALGCTDTSCATLTEPLIFNVTTASITNILCNGDSLGEITLAVTGGTAGTGYTYQWDAAADSATTQVVVGLPAGVFCATVNDANNCSASVCVTLTEPSTAVDVTATVNSNFNGSAIQCFGDSSGTALAVATGGAPGVGGYTFSWSLTSQTTALATGLPDGTFVVTAIDSVGCLDTAIVTLADPTQVVASTTINNTVSCLGGCDGEATISAVGGVAGYTVLWDAAAANQTTATATGLCQGLYGVTISDANGCSSSATVNITQPSTAVTASALVTSSYNGQDISCNNAFDGIACGSAVGGTPDYTYLWGGGVASGATTQCVSGLNAGTYSVTVSDSLGCSAFNTVTLTEPSAVTPSAISTVDVSCFGDSTGAATVQGIGGLAPYNFQWEAAADSQQTATATGLAAGSYLVTVLDANGCQGVDVVVVGQPSGALNVTTSVLSSFPGGTAMQCFGDSSGQATVNVSGGSPIYNIIWDIGSQTTNTIIGLSDGTYCVTVTDAQGCSDTACVTLVEPLLLTANTTSDSALCNGGNTGSATVVASGGTGAGSYLYQWDASAFGQNTATANGLAAGLYNVTVIDANGCQTVVAATVNQPATGVNVGLVITSNYNGQDVSCNGAIDAIVNASATGGSVVGNYNYVWSNGTVDNPLVTVGAGQHCVIVTDDNGCSATDCITVTQPSAITATIVASTSVTCFNTCTGSATVAGAGGTAIPGYSYQWDTAAGSQTTAVAIGLCVGSYNVTVIDGNGCFAVASVIITQPTAPLTTALNVTSNYNGQQLSCAGASDAEITATVTGGDGSYTISWNNSSSTTNVAAALSAAANPHCVFIVDGLGCTDTACINLVSPIAVTCTIVATTPISCNGGSNGSATVNPGGGTGGFSFIWDDGQTTATAVGLSAGPICVTITDANGCAATACTNLSDPAALSLTATINSNYNGSNVSCAGACDGIVFATATGGTQPYQSYTWSTSGAGITDTITLACAGTVDVTVTDANGCIAVATTVTLTEPSAITATITASADASCNGQCDGTATVTAAGGTLTAGYTFLWSASAGAQTTASATGLCSGTHNVTVTDNNNCNAVTSVFIDQPLLGVSATAAVSSNFNAADVSCFGACDGEATATGAGGTLISGYTFQWDIAAAAQTTSIASGLCAGVYSVTVSDNGGCSNVANVTLTDPSQLSTTIVSTVSVSCGGGNDGQATVSASGGTLTTGYTYLWDASANGQTTTTATGLPGDVGINVSVTDNNGCVSVATVTITQPANALFVNPVVVSDFNGQAISCNGACDAIVAVQTAGGIPGYSINWNTAATTDTLSNLCPGTYVVTVTDNGNCIIVDSVVVTEPVALSASISSQNNVSCTGGNDACVTIQGAGGMAGYSYSIVSGVTQANNGLFCNLTAGNYTVTVSDLNFCTTTVSVTITEPTALPTVIAAVSSDYLGQDISCFGACDADVTATATAGTAPYTYNWSMTTQNTATVTGICAGVFSVIITDSLGCTASASVTVVEPAQLVGQLTATTEVACFGDSTGTASFSTSGGIAPYTYNNGLSSTTTLSSTATLLNIPAGAYLTTITDGNGCSVLVPFAITSPPVLTNTASVTSSYANGTIISCNGLCDGAATAVGTGGNPGSTYNFLWSASANSQTSFTATGLCAGTHSVTITDQNGCSAIDSVTLNEPIQLAATSSGTGIDCFGGATGSVQVNAVTGTGTPNYTYTLGSVTNSTGLFSNLGIGTYCVTITDGNNCSIVECVTLSQNTLLVASAFVSSNYNGAQTSCQNSSDGEATVNVTGGIAPYTFLWSAGASNQTSQTAVGLAAGTFAVTVTDVFGCNDTDTVIIVSPDSVILDVIDTVHITCFGQPTGSFTVAASGGVGPYTYSFDGGVTFTNQVQYTNLPANPVGSGYCVIVQDANGCQTTTCVTINEPTQLQGLADSITMVSCFGGADGVIAVSGVGGTPPYGFSFNGGLSTSTNVFNGLIAGNYTIVITDSEACQTTMSNLIVTQPPVLILTVDTTKNPSCTGDCDGVIQVTASQGSGGFEYSIDGISYQATGNFTNLCAGGYTLFVRDVQGCITSIPVTLSQPTFVLANATVTSDYNGFDVTCNTACDGAATATPSGGISFSTGLYLYQWSVLGSTTQSVTGLCANTLYTVTVIDANGCTDVDSVTLTEPTLVDANYVQVTNESCFGNDGVIAVTAVIGSGVGPYTYDIGTGSSAIGTFTGLTGTAVGTPYSVTITDANNCTTVLDTFLTLPAVLDITDISVTSNFNGQDISCFGAADGAATIAHTGGNAPISYLWDISTGAQTTITANGLRAGTYAVTITDAAGCTADTSIVLTQPTPLIMTAQVDSSAGCNGASGGQISATPSGSVPAYSYAIDSTGAGVPTVFGTDSLWANLSAGTYTIYVQDFNGCGPVSQLLTIGDDAPITTITSVLTPFNGQAIACNGDSTATATVASTGGSVGVHFIYQWDTNAATQTGTTATGLAAGVYFVTITDTVSTCTDIAQVTVNEPSLVSVNIDTVVNVDCYGQATGAVQVSGLGGTPSYTYSIDYPASQSPLGTFVGLPEGNYSITTTDANTCTATVTVSITDPDSLAIDLDTVNVSCFGLSDGAITAVVIGGTPFSTGFGYSVTWSPAAAGAIDTLASLTAGTYTMTVQDARGCLAVATAAVIEPTPIVVATDSLVPATCADTNGLLVLTASGGPSQLNGTLNNFEYSIDGGLTFQSTPVFSNLTSGFYDIVVRDLGYTQCIGVYAVDLGSNSNITGTVDVSNESCFGYADGTASVFTSSTAGGYTYEWSTSVSSTVISTDQTATGLDGNIVPNTTGGLDTNFIYIVQVTDADGCVYIDSAYIESPDSLVVTASLVADVSCYGGADGMLNATVSGRDSLEVDYLWSNGATTAMSTGFTATPPDTIYTITITDSVGCNASDDIVISQPELPLAAFMTGSTVSCTDSTDGLITVNSIGGGTLPYLYSYSVVGPYGSDAILTQGLAAGIYTVYVQDGNGCTDSVENIVIRDTLDYIVTAFQDATINMGETVDLYGTVNNSNVDSSLVSWSMLDPNTGIITPLFTGNSVLEGFTPDTFYTDMQFILALNNGCGDTSVVEILVNQEQSVYIPNGFSPNGDGYNDIFTIYGSTDVEKVKTFMVFDRWGELIHLGQDFEPGSTDPVNGWDGKFRGKPMNPSVLVYYAEIVLVNGETVIRKGDVTLVR